MVASFQVRAGAYSSTSGGLTGAESDGTQLLSGDDAFSSGWIVIGGGSVTLNTSPSPTGTTTAARFTETGSSNRKTYLQTVAVTDAVHTLSFYLSYATRRYAQVAAFNANGASSACLGYYDLVSGTVTDTEQLNAAQSAATGIAAGANGFYKCSLQFRLAADATSMYATLSMSDVATYGSPLDGDSPSYTGDGVSSFLMWRPKLSLGAF